MLKMSWLKTGDNLLPEIRQCREEGRDIGDLVPEAEKILHMPESEEKEAIAGKMILEMENRPLCREFPYVEPDQYEDILASLEKSSCMCSGYTDTELRERLAGAWTGRACGCLLGIPVEGWNRQRIHDFLVESGQYPLQGYMSSKMAPGTREKFLIEDNDADMSYGRKKVCWINNVTEFPVDDDMNYTMLSLCVLESKGKHFTSEDIAGAWLHAVPSFHTCTAERIAYRNLMHCILPPRSGSFMNPYREWIGAQIRVDFYGWINPGNPREAARMAYRDAVVAQTGNGVYAAMFIAALISLMPMELDYRTALLEALKQIPPKSRLHEKLLSLIDDFDHGFSLARMIDRIHEAYNEKISFDWCHAIPNALIVAAVLLHEGNHYSEAICQAVLAGFDTDCNAATVGSVIGYRVGLGGIDPKWTAPVRQIFHSSVYGYESAPIPELVERSLKVIHRE